MPRLFRPGYCTPCNLPADLYAFQASLPRLVNTLPPACLSVCWTGYSAQATEHPATCLPACLLARLLCQCYCTPCRLPACPFAGQATLPRLLNTLPPACLTVCWAGYFAKATANPATCLFACLLARLFCPGYSTQATAHPATCLPSCLLSAQATLPRVLNTLPPVCLSVCWTGYSSQATAHPATCLPACLLARLHCPEYSTPCHMSVRCPGYSAQASEHPASCLPVCWSGYSAQVNAHPATCLPARLLARLLCPAIPAA